MSNIKLIQAKTSDLAFLSELRKASMLSHLQTAGIHLSDEEHLQRVKYHFDCAHIIWFQDKKVGLLKYLEKEDEVSLLQFQLLPPFQGKGLGTQIMEHYLQLIKPIQKPITLKVLKANPAQHLYMRLGFQIVGQDEYEYFMELKR